MESDHMEELDDSMEQLEIAEDGGKTYILEAAIDEDDEEDNRIKPTDAILVTAVTEDDFSHLEVQIFTDDGNLFVHHDITLPEFPLSLAWCDCPPYRSEDGGQGNLGNYIAVGTFDPAIEIWNLDVLDPLEPTAVLGGTVKSKKSNMSKKSAKYVEGSHTDAVMALAWNKTYRQAIASGSADHSVKIWDITTQRCSHTFTHHSDKVQSIAFNPIEAWMLATGGFDKSIALIDCRSGSVGSRYSTTADMESMAWNPFQAHQIFCSLEDGLVLCIDNRRNDKPLYSFQAHDKTTSSISFSQQIPGMLATASIDKVVKIWDVQSASASSAPALVAYKSMAVGKLFTMQFYPDSPFVLAAGGDKGMVAVWESDETKEVEERFASRISTNPTTAAAEPKSNPMIADPMEEDLNVEAIVEHEEAAIATEPSKQKKNKKKSKDKHKK
jgi:periodic tryptophan protein 1